MKREREEGRKKRIRRIRKEIRRENSRESMLNKST
jgi:hypothetical protein